MKYEIFALYIQAQPMQKCPVQAQACKAVNKITVCWMRIASEKGGTGLANAYWEHEGWFQDKILEVVGGQLKQEIEEQDHLREAWSFIKNECTQLAKNSKNVYCKLWEEDSVVERWHRFCTDYELVMKKYDTTYGNVARIKAQWDSDNYRELESLNSLLRRFAKQPQQKEDIYKILLSPTFMAGKNVCSSWSCLNKEVSVSRTVLINLLQSFLENYMITVPQKNEVETQSEKIREFYRSYSQRLTFSKEQTLQSTMAAIEFFDAGTQGSIFERTRMYS